MTDKMIIEQYINFINFLSEIIGDNYEIIFRDLTKKNFPIILAKNNHITNIDDKTPLTNISKKLIANSDTTYVTNLEGINKNGHAIRSSTFLVKNSEGKAIGIIGIHFDDSSIIEAFQKIIDTVHPQKYKSFIKPVLTNTTATTTDSVEYFTDDLDILMSTLFNNALLKLDINDPISVNSNLKVKMVKELMQQGFFNIKGAVPYAAAQFDVSNASIYRYQNESKNI